MNILEKFSLKNKVSIITGGERNIGLEIAVAFAQAGSDIVIAGIDEESAKLAISRIEAEKVRCMFIKTDVSNIDEVAAMTDKVVAEYKRIDVLVNNAGIGIQSKAEEMTLDTWNKVIDVNLKGPFLVSQAVVRVMINQQKGSIIFISSISGLIVSTPATQINYSSSKAGVIHLMKSLASEWAPHGIRVNSIAPGYMRTALTQYRFQNPDDPGVRKWLAMTPMGRLGYPEELAGLALYFASDASTFTTGVVVAVDGGYTAW